MEMGGYSIRILDEHGCAFPHEDSAEGIDDGSHDFRPYWTHFRCFPRREPKLTVQLADLERDLGQITIANPLFKKFPVWEPEPTPIKRETNGLIFELNECVPDWPALKSSNSDRFVTFNPWSIPWRIDCEVHQGKQKMPGWEFFLSNLEDVTGNSLGPMCRAEAAWKYHIEAFRGVKSNFTEEEIWRVRNLPVPSDKQTITLDQGEQSLRRGRIRLYRLERNRDRYSTHQDDFGPRRTSQNSATNDLPTILEFRVDPAGTPSKKIMIVRGKDNRGVEFSGRTRLLNNSDTDVVLHLSPDAKSFDCEMVLEESVHFSFIAKPPLLPTSAKSAPKSAQ